MVYMFGKFLWCLFEEIVAPRDPLVVESFDVAYTGTALLRFPEFRKTPSVLRECILRCTAGAPELRGVYHPFMVQDGVVRLRDSNSQNPCVLLQEAQAAVRVWWAQQVLNAERYVESRQGNVIHPDSKAVIEGIAARPKMTEVMECIRSVQDIANFDAVNHP